MDIYKCEKCGTMVEVLQGGTGGGVKVMVGSVAHPMEAKHYIMWIEIIADGIAYRQFLNPGDAPEATFNVAADQITARELCNLHGLWKA